MRLFTTLALLLVGCGGPPTGQCEEQTQCDEGFNCNPADYVGACGSTASIDPPCDGRGDACTTGQGAAGLCWYVEGACGIEHECRVACTVGDDTTCEKGPVDGEAEAPAVPQICRDDGQCTPASCLDGEHTCPADTVCVDVGGDANGCMHPSCTDSKDCGEDQHCVVGRCFLEYGECQSDLF